METSEDKEIGQHLDLYQAFLKLYEHHRGLLDELFDSESSTSALLLGRKLLYIQAKVSGDRVELTTNLIGGQTQTLTQPQNTWTIGRDSRQVGIAVADKRLSRCHAAIRYIENQGFYLIDLNSSNGSFINNDRVREPRCLQEGDRIRLGGLTIAFFMASTQQQLAALAPNLMEQIISVPIDTASLPDAEVPSRALSDAESVVPPDKTTLITRSPSVSQPPEAPNS